jgi:hypothetical protein
MWNVLFVVLLQENIETCQRTARQRLDEHPAIHARNRTRGLSNPFLSNGSVNTVNVQQWKMCLSRRMLLSVGRQ